MNLGAREWLRREPAWLGSSGRAANVYTGMGISTAKDWTADEIASRLNDHTISPDYKRVTDKCQHGCC
jgi:hypothetical protein